MPPVRSAVRYGCVAAGGFLAGNGIVSALTNWREWHRWAGDDPSVADLYRTNFWFDLASSAAALALAALLFHLLRPGSTRDTPSRP